MEDSHDIALQSQSIDKTLHACTINVKAQAGGYPSSAHLTMPCQQALRACAALSEAELPKMTGSFSLSAQHKLWSSEPSRALGLRNTQLRNDQLPI